MLKVLFSFNFINSSSLSPSFISHKLSTILFMEPRRRSRRSSSITSSYFSSPTLEVVRSKRQSSTGSGDDHSQESLEDPAGIRIKKLKRSSTFQSASTPNQVNSSDCASPFATKGILSAVEDYSVQLVVNEVEKKEIEAKLLPVPDVIKQLDDSSKEEITEPLDVKRFVFFDLETGGLSAQKADILEIAAISYTGELYSTYVLPQKKINPMASRVNHISFRNGQLMFRGKVVSSLSLKNALDDFFLWLKKIGDGDKVVLVAHNSKFDSRFLVHYLVEEGLEHVFLKVVAGFIDTIPMFKKIHPNYATYKQDFLVSKFLPKQDDYDAHSAVSDVKYLRKLFQQELVDGIKSFEEFSYSGSHALRKELMGPKIAVNITSYKHLIKSKVTSKSIATKLSALDYRYDELVAIYKNKGQEGLKSIFTDTDSNGCPRITSSETVLSKIIAYFDKKYKEA